MKTVTFTDLKKTFKVPGSFNELSRRQLITIVQYIHTNLPDYAKKFRILRTLLNVGGSPFFTWLFKYRLKHIDPAQLPLLKKETGLKGRELKKYIAATRITEMFPLTDFALKESDLTKNLIPSFRLPWSFKRWYGPDDYLKNIIFREFTQTEKLYAKFQSTGKVEYLDKLIAVLYRPKKKDYNPDTDTEGDCRERYNDFSIDRKAKVISRLPINIRLAILLYYHGCRNYIFHHRSFQSVFKKEKQTSGRSKVDPSSWEKAMMNMSEKAIEIENVAYTKLYTILFHLNEKIEANKEAMKPFKKSNA